MSDFMELTEVIDFAVSLLGSKPTYIKDNYKEVVREPRAVDQTAIGEQFNFSVRQLIVFESRACRRRCGNCRGVYGGSMIEPVSSIHPMPHMGREEARNRLKYAQDKKRAAKKKKEIEQQTSDYWEGRKA